jgi:general secretion pathway protein D
MTTRHFGRYVLLACWCTILVACGGDRVLPEAPEQGGASAEAAPGSPAPVTTPPAAQTVGERAPLVVRGSGELIGPVGRPNQTAPAADNGLELNFTDAPIGEVVRAILGDGLGAPFTVDAGVQGTVTLQSTQRLSIDAAVAALESALSLQGVALLNNNGVYQVLPLSEAQRRVTQLRPATDRRPGFGVYAVPLRFVSPVEMEAALQPFAPTGGILRADTSRNLLLLAGTSLEIAALLDVVRLFDVDWLAGMSFGLYPLEYVEADTIINELDEIFSGAESPIAGVVRFVPLARLNSLMVITSQARYLDQVETWIRRLDLGGSTPGRRIYVYEVQNARASDLAESLSGILSLDYVAPRESSRAVDALSDEPGSAAVAREEPLLRRASTSESRAAAGESSAALKIVPNAENNSLLIYASPSEFAIVEAALKRLDVIPIQVLIEASVAEVTLTDSLRWGLQWSAEGGNGQLVLSEASNGAIAPRFPGFSYLFTGSEDIRAVLNAIESVTDVHVLSAPKLMVLNNHAAELQIGDQVPIVTASAVATQTPDAPIVNSVEFRDTGVILSVTPRANQSGRVTIDVAQEVSDVAATTTSGIDSPTIQQRKFNTTVAVADGETIVLGGLIRESTSLSRGGVPFLSRVPGLGGLFGSRNRDQRRTELIVLLTPRVIRSEAESRQVTDELRRQFEALREMLPQGSQTTTSTDDNGVSDSEQAP